MAVWQLMCKEGYSVNHGLTAALEPSRGVQTEGNIRQQPQALTQQDIHTPLSSVRHDFDDTGDRLLYLRATRCTAETHTKFQFYAQSFKKQS